MKTQGTIKMEETINKFTDKYKSASPDSINNMMNYKLHECNFEEKTLTHSIKVEKWMLNPSGFMHGGLVSTAIDIAFGTLSIFLAMNKSPTIELNINFIRPVTSDDTIFVKVECVNNGRTISHMRGEIISQKTGKACATATGIFFNVRA